MLPDLSLLVALLLGLWSLGAPPREAAFTVAGTAACVLAGAALVRMAADRALAALEEQDLPAVAAGLRWTGLWPLLGWTAACYAFGWGALAEAEVPRLWWMAKYVVLFLPAAALFAAGWVARARIEAAVRRARGGLEMDVTPFGAVRQHARRNALALLPMVVLLGVVDGVYVLGELGVPGVKSASRWIETLPLLGLLVAMGLLTAVSLFLPRIFRRLVRTESLPAGSLRTLLERASKAIRLRYRDIVVWNTGGKVLNAMVIGLTGGTRTIFLTDGLLARLPEEEVVAVFAHEAGHAKRHHLPLYLLVFFVLAVAFEALAVPVLSLGVPPALFQAVQIAVLWFGLLGWLSRRFEREADAYGADHATDALGDPGPVPVPGAARPVGYGASLLMRALERIGRLTGHGRSMRHGSIEERLRFLADYSADPEVRQEFRRRRSQLYLGIGLLAVASTTLALLQLPGEVTLASAQVRQQEAFEAYQAAERARDPLAPAGPDARWDEALAGFLDAARRLEGRADARARSVRLRSLFGAADAALHGKGDREAARPLFERLVAEEPPADPVDRRLVFQSHVDLGRLAAGRGELAAARAHLEEARARLPDLEGEVGAWFRARVSLLQAVVEAREGVPTGLAELERLARAPRYPGAEWAELARDAREDLALVPIRR